jgi:hypothetical protein
MLKNIDVLELNRFLKRLVGSASLSVVLYRTSVISEQLRTKRRQVKKRGQIAVRSSQIKENTLSLNLWSSVESRAKARK